jgi:hypothetical protein
VDSSDLVRPVGEGNVAVRVFGSLRPALLERGMPIEFACEVPEHGVEAREIAEGLGLEMPIVEGVFVNHIVRGLSVVVMPGDQIGFVPNDIPGPHRYYLGLWKAGHEG